MYFYKKKDFSLIYENTNSRISDIRDPEFRKASGALQLNKYRSVIFITWQVFAPAFYVVEL